MTELEYIIKDRKESAKQLKLEAMEVAAAFETIAHEERPNIVIGMNLLTVDNL